ncbi:MAG: hypothetical protein ACLFS9_04755 [Nitriliruptoraceae bacterium]
MPATGDPPARDGDGLSSFAEDLEAGSARRRRGTARRRGRVLHEGVVHEDHGLADGGSGRARVRSEAQEGPVPSRGDAEVGPGPLLGADGAPLPAGQVSAPADDAGSTPRDPSEGAHHPGPSTSVVDPSVFLVMAVRSYLDGLDAFGPDDPRTADRLARLRKTLAVYDGDEVT